MDLQNNKLLQRSGLKRFALKATASAILTLNAEAVMAINCPAEISGSVLATEICDFNGGDPSVISVTVETGGTVGGILMNGGYAPADSFITVDAGGLVSNTTGIGISVTQGSSLTNGISNNGTISITSGIGISILTGSHISGGIFNSGMISANTTGIVIGGGSLITGDIFNSNNGTISSSNGTAINIIGSSITGNIFNNGQIIGGGHDEGISIVTGSHIDNNIVNSGWIRSDHGNGLLIRSNNTIGGNISNSGSISGAGSGISIFNTSDIQGNISNSGTISGGLNGLAIHNVSTVGGDIINDGTISGGVTGLAIYSNTTIHGSISNSGVISGGATGLNISITAAVTGGISNRGTIRGDTKAIFIANSAAITIDILGQQAHIIGDVEAVNTDVTVNILDEAVFTSEGSYTVTTFQVAPNALFNMAHTVTVTTGFNNSGTLAVGNALRTIAGDYTQTSGAVFQMGVTSTTNYGQLSVALNGLGTGIADLTDSGNIDVQVAQNASLHAGDVLSNVIQGAVAFDAPTSGFNVTDNSAIWKFIAELNGPTGVNLIATIDPTAYNVCQGMYCQGALNTIIEQVTAGNSLFGPYGALSTTALQTAASQATPELTNENIQIIQLVTRAVADIAPMWTSLRGRSSGDAMLYQPGKIWVKPYGASMTQNERNTVNGFNAAAYGAVIGKDIELSNHWMFGGAFAAGGDNIQGKSVLSGQTIFSNAYQGMVYESKKLPKQFYVAGQGLVGYENNNTSRAIPLYASTAKGSFNSWFTNIRAETGWSTHAFSPNWLFTPEIDASYLFINQGSYQESGSPMDLSVATNNNSSLVLGANGNVAYHLTTIKDQRDLTFTAYAGVAGDVINSQPQVTSTFVAAGSSFSTFGVQFNGAVFRGGAGLMFTTPTKPLIVELNYDLQVGNNAYSGVGSATIKYKL